MAQQVDQLFWFEVAVSAFFSILIFGLIFYFAVKYRRRSEDEHPPQIETNLPLEILWTVVPAIICVVMFVWGSELFVRNSRPPAAATEIFVTGKQWMWKIQHSNGKREIDALHIPVGVPIKLTMTSMDVIHDFFVPAFRVKKDVLPDTYTTLWFKADRVGKYHFFCNQYCGMGHSHMRGWVYVMSHKDYIAWVRGGVQGKTMAEAGKELYERFGCITCHGTGKAPPFAGVYGKPVKLSNGKTVIANNAYLRESILYPSAQIVDGYQEIMPTFKGQISEEQLLQLIAYIKSLGTEPTGRGE